MIPTCVYNPLLLYPHTNTIPVFPSSHDHDNNHDNDNGNDQASFDAVAICCELFGLSPAAFIEKMTSRRLLVEKEYMKVNISVGKALEGRDALAKEVTSHRTHAQTRTNTHTHAHTHAHTLTAVILSYLYCSAMHYPTIHFQTPLTVTICNSPSATHMSTLTVTLTATLTLTLLHLVLRDTNRQP